MRLLTLVCLGIWACGPDEVVPTPADVTAEATDIASASDIEVSDAIEEDWDSTSSPWMTARQEAETAQRLQTASPRTPLKRSVRRHHRCRRLQDVDDVMSLPEDEDDMTYSPRTL